LIILDEPFSGLDPINTNLIKSEIRELQQQGKSIIFSTHRMEQVEEICEQIVLINKGEKVLDGSMESLKDQFKQNLFRIDYQGTLPDDFAEKVQIETSASGHVVIRLEDAGQSNALLAHLLDKGVYIQAFNEILPTLNEIFIQQVQQEYSYA
ncbi:MAG: DUF4162 domain-containing protein, partial [Phaeodactylibacter sp.]|nr:DUF4162 domain-containing protein [Phaeodactylibacter sp.]